MDPQSRGLFLIQRRSHWLFAILTSTQTQYQHSMPRKYDLGNKPSDFVGENIVCSLKLFKWHPSLQIIKASHRVHSAQRWRWLDQPPWVFVKRVNLRQSGQITRGRSIRIVKASRNSDGGTGSSSNPCHTTFVFGKRTAKTVIQMAKKTEAPSLVRHYFKRALIYKAIIMPTLLREAN